MKERSSTSLTEGPITRSILLFTGPLIIGNLFQQLYNTTDSFIVGNFVGSGALATLIAQLVSAVCVLWKLTHTEDIYRLVPSQIRSDRAMLVKILKFGIPTGLQTAITSLSNVIVQSYLNGFGSLAMAGSNIYGKVDSFALLPANCLSLTTTTYIAQNMGARKFNRVKKGFKSFLWLGNVYAVAMGILLCLFSAGPLRLFTSDPEVVHFGAMMGQVLGPGYILLITCQILIGTARGAGDTLSTMLLSILNLCGLRILWLTIMIPLFQSIYTLYLGYPVTWGTAAVCMGIYYRKKSNRASGCPDFSFISPPE